ncbi:Virulence factors putative positive transcription regulator BvgA [Paraburkholderia humisilvae]|uniref:Virulence factors putative positive transcription regulator BvgA n=2 Tax=Paraburkholderia humisilvae TaxID=627669 RepID=A0A6J5DLG3_9BURK|nr:Virulence factors putative positive transcription regulator BvgA [Paraburkholderia humisilvae]
MPRSSIMVIDDHPAMRRALRQVFGETDEFNVVAEAGTAAQALRLTESAAPQLAIVDLRLPDLDGIELIPALRHVRPEMRVLVFSSADERIHAAQAKKAGAHGFVSKVREPSELLSSARLVLAGYTCFASDTSKERGIVLSERETAVLRLLIRGINNMSIAMSLGISPKTVSTYKSRLLRKLALRTVVDLVEYAKSNGIGH